MTRKCLFRLSVHMYMGRPVNIYFHPKGPRPRSGSAPLDSAVLTLPRSPDSRGRRLLGGVRLDARTAGTLGLASCES